MPTDTVQEESERQIKILDEVVPGIDGLDMYKALADCKHDTDSTIRYPLKQKSENDLSLPLIGVNKTVTSAGGARVRAQKPETCEGLENGEGFNGSNVVESGMGNTDFEVDDCDGEALVFRIEHKGLGEAKGEAWPDKKVKEEGKVEEDVKMVEGCGTEDDKKGFRVIVNEKNNTEGDFKCEGKVSKVQEDVEMKKGCDLGGDHNGCNFSVDEVLGSKSENIARDGGFRGEAGSKKAEEESIKDDVETNAVSKLGDDKGVINMSTVRVSGANIEEVEGDKRGVKESKILEVDGKACEDSEMRGGSNLGFVIHEHRVVKDVSLDELSGAKNEDIEADQRKVLNSENSDGETGRWNLSSEEWLQLPEHNTTVIRVDERAKNLQRESDEYKLVKDNKENVVIKLETDLQAETKEPVEAQKKVLPNSNLKEVEQNHVAKKTSNDPLVKAENKEVHCLVQVKKEPDMAVEKLEAAENKAPTKIESNSMGVSKVIVKKEADEMVCSQPIAVIVKKEGEEMVCVQPISARPIPDAEYRKMQMVKKCMTLNVKEANQEKALSTVIIEDGEFQEEQGWFFVGRSVVEGLSTTKGRKLENNEIVDFAFPNYETSHKLASFKAARAAMSIVRFSTKRNGQIGKLAPEWADCLIPLVNSKKVKVLGRCVAAPTNLDILRKIMLYVSFYIHYSVFTETDVSSWKLEPTQIDSTIWPLLQLFKLLKINPFQKAEFTPEELDSRKRSLNLGGGLDEVAPILPMAKRRAGTQQYPEPNNDEQVVSEVSINRIVGAVDVYDLKEMDPPDTLMCNLKPYQKQALYWMSESEKGVDVEEAEKMLHPCWAAYRICDKRAPAIYLNIFSGEATTRFPTATQMARGGILADAMGLGKTVMTIALILARRGRGSPGDQECVSDDENEHKYINKRKRDVNPSVTRKVKGGTLIICPMALLSQWKNELDAHSKLDSISIFVHYEKGRSENPSVLAAFDVVLTTYGVLSSSYKSDAENSVFHRVDWYRVVLDEAHTIKNSKCQVAQATYTLSSYCRWCLTGTPIQNSLEDLYSLLCFLHVEPWCNKAWWNKLIQKPYENGDKRGLKLIKAILRPLMLRRTKETRDKNGRPILVLPPTDIQIIECQQSEAERDFYDALFRRSKVQFDQFVAQGKVLHNYANILELLLRLRQCCNHPFLVMSRGDTQEYADLNKLARKFLETNPENASPKIPSRAYVEEVVEGLRKGENTECPICMESADDPVLTPCAHKMCRECLLSSWRSPTTGYCPICRQLLKKTELITCPSENRFRLDIEKNWKESSKVTKLMNCLEHIRRSGSGEKSIVFSQWTSFLDLLQIPLRRRKIAFLRFDGKLSQKQRERVLDEFNENKEKTVLLMSLRAGGVGLNLTVASNVFLMDPWWNPAVEEQAIMRIHRIGQMRTVRIRRFIVKGTLEERMQQVQARKENMIAGALTDEDVRAARLEELKMLFR